MVQNEGAPNGGTGTPDGGDDYSWVSAALTWAGDTIFGGNPRSGGADPCCPPGYNPSGAWPRNALQDGAPPDYRTRGSPMEDPSPSGTGRLKDDFCDCIPIRVGGRWWVLGSVDGGSVEIGPPADLDAALWVEVDPATGRPLSVPGFGSVQSSPTSGAGGGSGAPVTVDGEEPHPARASVGVLLGIALVGAMLVWRG